MSSDSLKRFLSKIMQTALLSPFKALSMVLLCCMATSTLAAPSLPFLSASGSGNTTSYGIQLQALILFTALSFLPAAVLMMTSFTRLIIVFSLLRQALGTGQAPPNQVLVGLALFLSFFIMSPTLEKVYNEAYLPYSQDQISGEVAWEKATPPMRNFMLKQTRQEDLALFIQLAKEARPSGPDNVSLKTLIPAFAISELKTAFQIGFMIFLPFLIIDMVVASVLMSMGMMMLSPSIISLPFKLMLFVLVDGWNILIASLVQSF
jgi:flagellar biosynthesis protein FliP